MRIHISSRGIRNNRQITLLDEEPIEGPRRRTWLAAERTWLAWWRTALGTSVAAIGVGAALPKALSVDHGWLYAVLGLGYAAIAIALFVTGARRQSKLDAALVRGDYNRLSPTTVMAFTLAGVVLATFTAVLLIIDA